MSDFELPGELPKRKPSPSKQAQPTLPSAAFKDTADVEKEVISDPAAESSEAKTEDTGEPQYAKEELLRVFDEIIFSGEYQETYTIKGRIRVTFKTRTAEEINKIQRTIDASGLNLISSVETVRSFLTLQYSLAEYHKHDLSVMKIEDRAKFVENLPGPIVGMLLNLLNRFDHKVAKACEEGKENF